MALRPQNKEFSIIKFQMDNILLMHKPTQTAYQYFQIQQETDPQYHITHPSLIRPIVYHNGLLYPRGISNLEIQLQNRRRAHKAIHYEEEEIINTFSPIINCLAHIHSYGIVHGGITASSILITQSSEVKMKDWLIEAKQNGYYANKKRSQVILEQDYFALGNIIAQTATLRKELKLILQKDVNSLLQNIIDRYSKGFFFAMAVLLKKNKNKLGSIIGLMNNQDKLMQDRQLNNIFDSIKKEKDRKKITIINNQNIVLNSNSLKPTLILSLHDSPLKKETPINSLANSVKRTKEDGQNKKHINQDSKKKQIDKISKIIERSNDFVNELMARKNNQQILKKIAAKPNITNFSLYAVQTGKKIIKQNPLLSSPIKKIRTMSKKK